MKRLKGTRRKAHKLILQAVKDYYGQYDRSIKIVAQYLCGKSIKLSEKEKSDVWAISENLKDEVYIANLFA